MSYPLEYVEYGSRVSAPPPVCCRGGRFLALVLKGDAKLIEDLCRRTLNVPAEGDLEYVVLTPYVLMLAGTFDEVSSLAPGYEEWGLVQEAHVSVWVPLAAGKREEERFAVQRMCLAVPFIWVDNPLSYAGGREDFGFPKAMAQFSPQSGLGEHVEVQAFGGEFGRGNRAGWAPVLELDRGRPQGKPRALDQPGDEQAPTWSGTDQITAGIEQLEKDEGTPSLAGGVAVRDSLLASTPSLASGVKVSDIVRAVLQGAVRQVFLKQFRDAKVARQACYRTIVEASFQPTDVSVRPLLQRWQVTVHRLKSHPLAEELGLDSQPTRLTFGVQMDMTIDPGSVVAPVQVTRGGPPFRVPPAR